MEVLKSILVASERLFGCASDPLETMRQTHIVTEVCANFCCFVFVVSYVFDVFLCVVEFYPDSN